MGTIHFPTRMLSALSLLQSHRRAALLLAGAMACGACSTAAAEEPQTLRFADFFAQPIGARGPQPSAVLLAAHNQRVRLTGYMVAQERPRPGRFFLVPRPLIMSEHADGEADDLPPATVTVIMPPAERDLVLPPSRGLLQLTGTLQVGRQEHDDGRVSWVRLMLEPRSGSTAADTTRSTPTLAATP